MSVVLLLGSMDGIQGVCELEWGDCPISGTDLKPVGMASEMVGFSG